jgi:alcohol dehydrogenase, propanol-preferring
MRAVQVASKCGNLGLVDKPIPNPRVNEVLIKVQVCGVCHGGAVTKAGITSVV